MDKDIYYFDVHKTGEEPTIQDALLHIISCLSRDNSYRYIKVYMFKESLLDDLEDDRADGLFEEDDHCRIARLEFDRGSRNPILVYDSDSDKNKILVGISKDDLNIAKYSCNGI